MIIRVDIDCGDDRIPYCPMTNLNTRCKRTHCAAFKFCGPDTGFCGMAGEPTVHDTEDELNNG